MAQEKNEGVAGTMTFRFEAGTGRLALVEVPCNLLARCVRIPPLLHAPDVAPRRDRLCTDPSFWQGASRRIERAIAAPVRASWGACGLQLEFGSDRRQWQPVSSGVWIAVAEDRLAGLRCTSNDIDFDKFAQVV
jgi:hypothetical protein